MAKQTIGIGTSANDGTGDPARTAFGKCNDNFDEIYGVSGIVKGNGSNAVSAATAGTDYVAPDGSGNIGVNTATPNLLGAGKALTVYGGASGDNLGHCEVQGSRSSADSTFGTVDFWHQTTRVAAIFAVRGSAVDQGYLAFCTKDAGSLSSKLALETGGVLRPTADNTQTLGTGSFRWSVVYAGTGTINTSDGTKKTVRGGLTEDELAAWGSLEWVIYQFNDAIAEKGADVARLHCGLTAQMVRDAFAAHGLDAHRYGLFCEDDEYVSVEVGKDQDGTPICENRPTGRKVLGLRYEECLAFEAAYVRSLLQR